MIEKTVFFEIREPGRVPVKKRPWTDLAESLKEILEHYPSALVSVIQVVEGGDIWIDDAPEFLHMLNGKYRHLARADRRFQGGFSRRFGSDLQRPPG